MKKLFLSIFLITSVVLSQDFEYSLTVTPNIKVVIVSVEQPWTSTGIQINSGDKITIMMEGFASTNAKYIQNSAYWNGPEGINTAPSNCPVPNFPLYSVVGKIGSNGTPFYVGRILSIISKVSGILYLGINDAQSGGIGDNYGYFVAFITGNNTNVFPITSIIPTNNIPDDFTVSQNYPNPFNPSTTINYEIPGTTNVQIKIYDINGRLIKTLVNEIKDAGGHSIDWDGKNDIGMAVATGTYLYQVQLGNNIQAKKMLLLK